MRKDRALNALFPTLRGDVLAAMLTKPDKWWYLSELAQHLRTRPSSLQRELKGLVHGGILEERRDGRRVYFKAESRSPLFGELRALVEKAAGLHAALSGALVAFGDGIDFAFLHGSVAAGAEHAASDVDLLVVGTVGLAQLAPALRAVERRIGREVNVTIYSLAEFRQQVAGGDHFLLSVLRSPKQFLKGSERELDGAVGASRRSRTPNVEKGTRRPARARRS